MIATRAYELFARRGFVHGHDVEDWLAAEAELRDEAQQVGTMSTKNLRARPTRPVTRANKTSRK
jgi:hypothetical protein